MSTGAQLKNNRMIFLLIVGIPITIVLAASWLWYFVAKGDLDLVAMLGTANHGTLVQPPRQLDEADLSRSDSVFVYADLEPQWTFVIPGDANCEASCENLLYLTRQIHIAMGKYVTRIRRFYVSDTASIDTRFDLATLSDNRPAPADFGEFLESEHPGASMLVLSGANHSKLFGEFTRDPSTWYLVDPAGWIMMSYNDQVSYKDVMSDLKFLLKNSSE